MHADMYITVKLHYIINKNANFANVNTLAEYYHIWGSAY